MNAHEYLKKMYDVHNLLLDYIDEEVNEQEKLNNFLKLFNSHKIVEDKHLITSTIHLLSSIINYHHRATNFFNKIFNIILFLKNEFPQNYSDFEIFEFFKRNKRVILFLIKEKIINLNSLIVSKLNDDNFNENSIGVYLKPEIERFTNEKNGSFIEIPENIEELRQTEYSDNPLLQLVHDDSIDEFIKYISETNLDLEKEFYPSMFETNLYLSKNHSTFASSLTLIEYAAFFGSIKIFKYLVSQKVKIDSKLWIFAIHGRNAEIIHIIEDKNIEFNEQIRRECLKCSIRCHHNELTNYLLNNYINDSNFVLKQSLKYYNFYFIDYELIDSDIFYELCKRDYFYLATSVINADKNIDINLRTTEEKSKKSNKTEKTVLFVAVEKGNLEIVQFLLENKNIDVNKKIFIINSYEKKKIEITPLCEAI